jgi:uncharacterized OsmC-like protein
VERGQLREIQAPLKERYREDQAAAMVTLKASGELGEGVAFRGTLAVDRDAPVGFGVIRLAFTLDCDADDEQLETLLRLTERYCVVFQTLARPPELSARIETA